MNSELEKRIKKRKQEILNERPTKMKKLLFSGSSERLKQNKEHVLKSVELDGSTLEFASLDLRDDKEVVMTALANDITSFQYASEKLKKDKEFIAYSIENTKDYFLLEFFDSNLKKELVLNAIKKNPLDLELVDKDFQNNEEIVRIAIQKDPKSFMFASDILRNSKELVEKYPRIYPYSKLTNDSLFLKKMLEKDYTLIKFANPKLKRKAKIIKYAYNEYVDELYFTYCIQNNDIENLKTFLNEKPSFDIKKNRNFYIWNIQKKENLTKSQFIKFIFIDFNPKYRKKEIDLKDIHDLLIKYYYKLKMDMCIITPLEYVCSKSYTDILKLLFQKGLFIENTYIYKNRDGMFTYKKYHEKYHEITFDNEIQKILSECNLIHTKESQQFLKILNYFSPDCHFHFSNLNFEFSYETKNVEERSDIKIDIETSKDIETHQHIENPEERSKISINESWNNIKKIPKENARKGNQIEKSDLISDLGYEIESDDEGFIDDESESDESQISDKSSNNSEDSFDESIWSE